MRKSFLLICLLIFSLFAGAHSGKARFHVLIDTDGAADDLRAICMLLANRDVEVLSVTTSEGALTPAAAALKATALLHYFHHEGISVGVGRKIGITTPAWRQQSEEINWGDTLDIMTPNVSAKDLIVQTIAEEEEKVVFFALGTLTNLHDALVARPQLKEHIDRVIWYNSSAKPMKGANYEADRSSADKLLASGVKIEMVSVDGKQAVVIDEAYLSMVGGVDNVYAKKIVDTHRNEALRPMIASAHMKAWDDLSVVYLFAPELFAGIAVSPSITVYAIADAHALEQAKNSIVRVLTGKPDNERRVFLEFPEATNLYAADVATVAKAIIHQHGHSEWRAGVLANELHGHLGIYAIVGVKMGIRAREYFNIGVDDIVVTSYAGAQPPVSCMNDGIQVSTGATIGHGLISVADSTVRPEADFLFKNKTLRMKLKPSYAQQIRRDVEEGVRLYGMTEAYWLYVRALAIKYWQQFDRHEMFEMDKIDHSDSEAMLCEPSGIFFTGTVKLPYSGHSQTYKPSYKCKLSVRENFKIERSVRDYTFLIASLTYHHHDLTQLRRLNI
jgi:pyrimidine-specific ribonucleoside hydrolase